MTFVWSAENIAKLRELAPTLTTGEIGDVLGISHGAVRNKARRERIPLDKGDVESLRWSEAKIETLRELASTRSATQIGEIIGCTRNAVIGKCQRLGIALGKAAPKPVVERFTPTERPRPTVAPKPAPFPKTDLALRPAPITKLIAPVLAYVPSQGVVISDLTATTCRWPLGDPLKPDFRYCGADCPEIENYCKHHKQLSERPR